MVGVIAVIAVALGLQDGRRDLPDTGISLDQRRYVAGELMDVTVRVPPGSSEHVYGVRGELERLEASGGWAPAYAVSFALNGGEPSYSADLASFATVSIGFGRGGTWRLRVPPDARPGSYRLVKQIGARSYRASFSVGG